MTNQSLSTHDRLELIDSIDSAIERDEGLLAEEALEVENKINARTRKIFLKRQASVNSWFWGMFNSPLTETEIRDGLEKHCEDFDWCSHDYCDSYRLCMQRYGTWYRAYEDRLKELKKLRRFANTADGPIYLTLEDSAKIWR